MKLKRNTDINIITMQHYDSSESRTENFINMYIKYEMDIFVRDDFYDVQLGNTCR